jgi:hypothetical protein
MAYRTSGQRTGLLRKAEIHLVNGAKRRLLDTLSSPVVWFGSATPLSDVADLIACLRPVAAAAPLARFGAAADGGYLMPDDLDGVVACISPGVNREVGFDLDIANRGIGVYMADASVDGPPVQHERFYFQKKFLGLYDSDTTATIDGFCATAPAQGDLILQMDIEGAEYPVLASASEPLLRRFRTIVLECHDMELLFLKPSFAYMSTVFRRLLLTHRTVHIHPNNYSSVFSRGGIGIPRGMEFTFVRNDFLAPGAPPPSLPHRLDRDNAAKYPPVALPACWQARAGGPA